MQFLQYMEAPALDIDQNLNAESSKLEGEGWKPRLVLEHSSHLHSMEM